MLATMNLFCSVCLSTQSFLDLGPKLVCPRCNKQLHRERPAVVRKRGVPTLTPRPQPIWREAV